VALACIPSGEVLVIGPESEKGYQPCCDTIDGSLVAGLKAMLGCRGTGSATLVRGPGGLLEKGLDDENMPFAGDGEFGEPRIPVDAIDIGRAASKWVVVVGDLSWVAVRLVTRSPSSCLGIHSWRLARSKTGSLLELSTKLTVTSRLETG
jgi:hypothetical protein